MTSESKQSAPSPSHLITTYISEYSDWRGALLAEIREIVLQADPDASEQWKWGIPVWAHDGLVCGASAFKRHVKVFFYKGASLEDPMGLFNAGLDGKAMRSIDLLEGDQINREALRGLVQAAVAFNVSRK